MAQLPIFKKAQVWYLFIFSKVVTSVFPLTKTETSSETKTISQYSLRFYLFLLGQLLIPCMQVEIEFLIVSSVCDFLKTA